MSTVKAFIRTGKKDKEANIRFRLSDGRSVQLFHKSEKKVQEAYWDEKSGKCKKRFVPEEIKKEIDSFVAERETLLKSLYKANKDLTSAQLETLVDKHLHPDKYIVIPEVETMCVMFQRYVNDWYNAGEIGHGRKKHYDVVIRELKRFFIVAGIDGCHVKAFTKDVLLSFREFLKNEYKIVDSYPGLYIDLNMRNRPSKERSQNTIAEKLLLLQAFLTELEGADIIEISPFRKIGKPKKAIMKQQYDAPFFLNKSEFTTILNGDCPDSLQRVKDLFILQTCFGCRVGDFRNLTFDNIGVVDGIPYIHYLPKKTQKDGKVRSEVNTPIVRIAYDIIMKYRGALSNNKLMPFYPDGNGETGYNYQIKQLLKHYEITRTVAVFNDETEQNEYLQICDLASSKLARKTHVDMMNKVQVDKYAAGLHKRGSSAVDRYTELEITDRFVLISAAFGCDRYEVDNQFEIKQEEVK